MFLVKHGSKGNNSHGWIVDEDVDVCKNMQFTMLICTYVQCNCMHAISE